MANINEILARAAALRDETALNSISPERAGSIMYDTLIALNELWLQQGAALVINKIYASVAAMEADTNPVSDISGKPLRPGQIVVIASSDSDNGSVYRYNGADSPSWSLVGEIGNLDPVDNLESDSTSLPLAAHQGKVLDGKISQLGQKFVKGQQLFSVEGSFYRANTGVYATLSGCYSTPLLKIISTKKIDAMCYLGGTSYPFYGISFFDKNKQFISGYTGTTSGVQEVSLDDNVIPSNAVYMSAMLPNGDELDNAYILSGWESVQRQENVSIEQRSNGEATFAQQYVAGLENLCLFPGDFDQGIRLITNNVAKYIVVRVVGGSHLVISPKTNGVFAIVSEFDFGAILPYNLVFATGESSIRNLSGGYDNNLPADARYIIIRAINDSGVDYLPSSIVIDGYDLSTTLSEKYLELKARVDILNKFPNYNRTAYKGNAPVAFREKLLALENDIHILLLGDSMTALTDLAGPTLPNVANLPPGCQHNAITYQLWNNLVKTKPQYDRFDSNIHPFTESGTWALSDVEKQSTGDYGEYSPDNCVYRESSVANDSVSFNWDLSEFEKLNFIGRMGADGSGKIRISCTSGKIVVVHNQRANPIDGYTDGQLVEANGYEFTQFLPTTTGYHAQWLRNFPIKMKRVSGATGTITLTFTNITDSNGSVMYYWGTERWNFNTIHITNIARAGRSIPLLYKSITEEVTYRDVDLLVFQLPLWNELKAGGDIVPTINQRIATMIDGFLKDLSDNWAKFQLILNVYHTQKESWNGNNNLQFQANGDVSRPKTDLPDWTCVSQIINNLIDTYRGAGISVSNLYNEVYNWAINNRITMEEMLTTGNFTVDGTHCSSLGFLFYAEMIAEMMYD